MWNYVKNGEERQVFGTQDMRWNQDQIILEVKSRRYMCMKKVQPFSARSKQAMKREKNKMPTSYAVSKLAEIILEAQWHWGMLMTKVHHCCKEGKRAMNHFRQLWDRLKIRLVVVLLFVEQDAERRWVWGRLREELHNSMNKRWMTTRNNDKYKWKFG